MVSRRGAAAGGGPGGGASTAHDDDDDGADADAGGRDALVESLWNASRRRSDAARTDGWNATSTADWNASLSSGDDDDYYGGDDGDEAEAEAEAVRAALAALFFGVFFGARSNERTLVSFRRSVAPPSLARPDRSRAPSCGVESMRCRAASTRSCADPCPRNRPRNRPRAGAHLRPLPASPRHATRAVFHASSFRTPRPRCAREM